MEENFPDWKPVTVKLEPDLAFEDDLETDSDCPASHLDGSHRDPRATFVESNSVSPERICPNLAYGLPARPESTSGTSQVVKIKEEVEDETPSPDLLMDDCDENSAQTAPSAYNSVFFPEDISIKSEDNVIEGKNIAMEEPVLHDFVEANEERFKDPFHDVVATPFTIPSTKAESSLAIPKEDSMDNASEGRNTCNETTTNLDFEFVKVEIVSDPDSDNDDAENETEAEPTLNQHAAFHEEILPCPKLKSVKCTRVMDSNVVTDNDKCAIAYVSNQTSIGSSMSVVSLSDKPFMCPDKEHGEQSTEQSFSRKLCTAQSQSVDPKKKLVSPSDARPFSCNQCPATFSRNNVLRNHSLIHSGEKPFSCDQCPARFIRKGSLKTHFLVHSGEKVFSCDQCPACFNRKDSLKKHSLIHSGEKPFSCDQCPAKFTLKSNLTAHIFIHTGEKAFSCDQCPAKFGQRKNLNTHSLIHSGEKPFSCDQCPAKFSLKNILKKHSLIHSGEKPFSCDQCPAKFKRKSHLERHSLIHSAQKAFSCDQCPASFDFLGSLRKHSLIHSGEKAFSCDQCPAKFKRKSHLTRHTRIHSSERVSSLISVGHDVS